MPKIPAFVLCWFLASSSGYAQTDDWNAVTALSPGTPLRVELETGRDVKGVLQRVDDAQLTLETRVPVIRAQIRKIERLGARRTDKFARWGFLIGALGGASWGYGSTLSNRGTWALLLGAGWGSIGALIGAINGARSQERILIYRAP